MIGDDDATARPAAETRAWAAAGRFTDAQRYGHQIAAHLVSVIDELATTLDEVAVTRDTLAANSHRSDCDELRRNAQRAREFAEDERRESQRLREEWRLPPRV